MKISQRLRTCAKHTGLDAVIELPQEAADEIDAMQARAKAAQAEVTDDVELDEQFHGWIGTIKDAHDESLNDEHASSRSMLRGVIDEMEEARAILALRPERVPMAYEQIKAEFQRKQDEISEKGESANCPTDLIDFTVGIRFAEAHHGIKPKEKP